MDRIESADRPDPESARPATAAAPRQLMRGAGPSHQRLFLSGYGAVLFAAVTIALVSVGGSGVLISVFVAVLFAAIAIALVGIVAHG